MRVLVYGFGPYRQFRVNITERIISSLPKSATLRKVIFPVRFQRRQFIAALERHRPDIILGLGQSTRAQIEIESRARNRRWAFKSTPPRPIFKDRPNILPTSLKIAMGRSLGRSKDAGDYVCNYSMYVLLDEIARQRLGIKFGFIHIPHGWEMKKASAVVRKVLRQCRTVG
jgi:pyrrolidone-carboxylate peptidase